MWPLLKAEIAYHKKIFLSFFVFIPLFWLYAVYPFMEDMPQGMWIFMMLFLMLQYWNIFRNREKRDRRFAMLPVSPIQIALARILIVICACFAYILLYRLFINLFNPVEYVNTRKLLITVALILFLYSTYFISRDLLLSFFRRIGFNKNRMIAAAVLLLLGLNVLGLAVMMNRNAADPAFSNINPIITFFKTSSLFNTDPGVAKLLGTNFLFALLTVFSFRRRKAYLE
jgi:hypothetical protein